MDNLNALRFVIWSRAVQKWSAGSALLLMGILPALELGLRTFFSLGIPGSIGYVQHLTLWVGFLGAVVATSRGRHLSISVGVMLLSERWQTFASMLVVGVSIAVSSGLFWAGFQFVSTEFDAPTRLGGWLPIWIAELILPLAFGIIAIQFICQARSLFEWIFSLLVVVGIVMVALAMDRPPALFLWITFLILVVSALAGAPIFIILGGLGLSLFIAEGVPVAALPVETYRIAVSPSLPTIPLFALTGYILAEGGASRRLVRLFRALFGWMPGGLAVVSTLSCAFFSAFTGASGVTIVALAGLLMRVLSQNGYPERFTTGLLTATGSIGLLFPPSLAVILYGVVAHVSIPNLFAAGFIPGLLMVVTICGFGIYVGVVNNAPRPDFDAREALKALGHAKFEIMLPVVTLAALFSGFATLVEAASITVVYALVTETIIHRELHWSRDLPNLVLRCATLVGGVFVILGVAMGLTNYMVDAEIPTRVAAWVKLNIESRILFLLVLNLFLLLVGCLMDIFSAIVVVLPLILPIGEIFQIHPLHLAMIFLINMELGYLTPPVGLNLFLASFRFEKPVLEVARSTIPFFFVLLVVLLLVTYVSDLAVVFFSG